MADLLIKAVFLVLFFGVMVGIGIYCRRHVTDVNGFVLGGRSVGPWLTAFAYGTSYFSAVVFVGYAGQFGWKYGVAATWAGIGNAILGSLLAWVVLGRRTRVMSQHLDSATMPEFFGRRFGRRALKLCASALIFIFPIPLAMEIIVLIIFSPICGKGGLSFSPPFCFVFQSRADLCVLVFKTAFLSWAVLTL